MELAFLGINGGIQSKSSTNTSYIINTENHLFLIDSSGSTIQNILKADYDLHSLDGIFFTHSHIDHVYAFPSVIHNLWLMGRKNKLDIYGNKEVIELLKKIIKIYRISEKNNIFEINFIQLKTEKEIKFKDMKIINFYVPHGQTKTNGFIFESNSKKIVSFSDCSLPSQIPDSAFNCNILLYEAAVNSSENHSSAEEAAQIARKINAEKLFLIHLPPSEKEKKILLSRASLLFTDSYLPKLYYRYII